MDPVIFRIAQFCCIVQQHQVKLVTASALSPQAVENLRCDHCMPQSIGMYIHLPEAVGGIHIGVNPLRILECSVHVHIGQTLCLLQCIIQSQQLLGSKLPDLLELAGVIHPVHNRILHIDGIVHSLYHDFRIRVLLQQACLDLLNVGLVCIGSLVQQRSQLKDHGGLQVVIHCNHSLDIFLQGQRGTVGGVVGFQQGVQVALHRVDQIVATDGHTDHGSQRNVDLYLLIVHQLQQLPGGLTRLCIVDGFHPQVFLQVIRIPVFALCQSITGCNAVSQHQNILRILLRRNRRHHGCRQQGHAHCC